MLGNLNIIREACEYPGLGGLTLSVAFKHGNVITCINRYRLARLVHARVAYIVIESESIQVPSRAMLEFLMTPELMQIY